MEVGHAASGRQKLREWVAQTGVIAVCGSGSSRGKAADPNYGGPRYALPAGEGRG
jgi:hypothetical protein